MSLIDTSSGTPTYNNPNSINFANNKWSVPSLGFDIHRRNDLSGASSAFFNYWQQQQQNAYELELWNLNNQYNSPEQKMLRYQQAGLNPQLAYSDTSQGSPASASSPIAAKPTNFKAQNTVNALNSAGAMLKSLVGVMQGARDVYQFSRYGETYLEQQNRLARTQADLLDYSADSRRAEMNALSWLYGSGIPYNSPFMRKYETGIMGQVLANENTKANTGLTRANTALTNQKIPWTIADIMRVNADTGRIEMDTRRLHAIISNINSDTAVKNYMLNNMYPLDYSIKDYQLHNLMPMDLLMKNSQRNLMDVNNTRLWLGNETMRYQAPWININTGSKVLDDFLRYGANKGDKILDGLMNNLLNSSESRRTYYYPY